MNQGSRFAVDLDCGNICNANTSNSGAACNSDSECNKQCYPLGGGAPTGACTIQADCPGTEICKGGCILEAPCGVCQITGINAGAGNCRCANDITTSCDQPLAADPSCGGGQCECYLDSPLPLSTGGVSTCHMQKIVAPITGAIDVDFGPLQLDIATSTDVYLGNSLTSPCPTCDGGTCNGGERDGLSCIETAQNATFGDLSLDCPPDPLTLVSGSGIKARTSNTTGTSNLTGTQQCDFPLGALTNCHCSVCSLDPTIACTNDSDCAPVGGTCTGGNGGGADRRPNGCADLTCTPGATQPTEGSCLTGLPDSFCAGAVRHDGSGYIPCSTDLDCDAVGPGVGPCASTAQRRCFPDIILASGVPSPNSPVTVSSHCIAPTASAAVNSSLGPPGPARVAMQMTPTIGCGLGNAIYEPEMGGCFAPKTIFVTSTLHDGNLGGLTGADAICNARAAAAGLPGTFTAWLSDSIDDARERVTHSLHPYVRTDGTKIADSWTDLVSGTLLAPIGLDENGSPPLGGTQAHTATTIAGLLAGGSCSDWTSTAGTAQVGNSTSTTPTWTEEVPNGACSSSQHLYCFED